MATQPIYTSLDASATLSKAVIRTAERLHLSKTELSKVLGLSPPTITRLYSGHYVLEEKRKEWEFALLLIRVFRSLDSILANEQAIQQWLNSNNHALGGKPIELIQQTEGLVRVIQYLDSSRGIV
jgi:hypothetical protein